MEVEVSAQQTKPAWRTALPFLAGASVLGAAVLGAALTGDSINTTGLNGFVEARSGSSGTFLSDLLPGGLLLTQLGFAFAAGMVAAVNPCGFAMLPAYLGLYMGSRGSVEDRGNPAQRIARGLLVGATVTGGFVVLFGIAGLIFGLGTKPLVDNVKDLIGWFGLGIGALLAIAGSYLLAGGKFYSGLAGTLASRIGDPGHVSVRGYFLFGVSYGTASLSCTLPIFLAVLGVGVAGIGFDTMLANLLVYGLGMGAVIMGLTLAMALFKGAMVGGLRKILPFMQPVSAVLMLVAGSYIVFYWLTIGGLW